VTAALALRDVRKSFGPIEVLHGIDFDLNAGEVHALIGENGAGKSTIMKILGGYLAPTSGSVVLGGAGFALWLEARRPKRRRGCHPSGIQPCPGSDSFGKYLAWARTRQGLSGP
jgi:ABC-type sugar transport system ATPase subunit